MALNDEYIEVRGIALAQPSAGSSENVSSLVVKVTEIRDGARRATLFLGDIEQAQQSQLFSSADAGEIFRDVRAVTLPHHGRPSTLVPGFFAQIKRLAGPGVIVLHSDATPPDPQVAREAAEESIRVVSTASADNKGADVLVNLYSARTSYRVGAKPTPLAVVVRREKKGFVKASYVPEKEVLAAVARYCNRSPSAVLEPGTVLSMPSDVWIRREIGMRLEREVQEGLRKGWVVKRNENIDGHKLFVYGGNVGRGRFPTLRYVIKEGDDGTWRIYKPGRKDRRGIPSYGKPVGTMQVPTEVNVIDRTICEYCGREAIGKCTIRHKWVCEKHRYFTQGGVNWICP
jgi:hypothetical protein